MVDTTVKSGLKFLAPTWTMIMGHKEGLYSDSEYTSMYLPMMEGSQLEVPEFWAELVTRGEIALACYCRAHCFCHRYLLVEVLRDYCRQRGIHLEYRGELQ